MTKPLTERLRKLISSQWRGIDDSCWLDGEDAATCQEAVDVIERLTAQLAEADAIIEYASGKIPFFGDTALAACRALDRRAAAKSSSTDRQE